MTVIEHLSELRSRIFKALIAIVLGAVVGFIWYDHGLLEFLKEPYCALPSDLRWPPGSKGCTLLFFGYVGIETHAQCVVGPRKIHHAVKGCLVHGLAHLVQQGA